MSVDRNTIAAMNRDLAGLAIASDRLDELRIEVDELAAAARGALAELEFDREPSDFVTVLLAMAARYSRV